MRRFVLGLVTCVLVGWMTAASAQTPAELQQTASVITPLQNDDGGFTAKPGGTSTLGATSSALRILKYTGGEVRDVVTCIRFVESCFDRQAGGFAQTPGGKPDVPTTASGLMAVHELKIPADSYADAALKFFEDHARTFEEVRIAVAGLEAVGRRPRDVSAWTRVVNADRNPDGTWGHGQGQARATGGAAVALLRMGVELDHKDAILKVLRDGQQPDGGWTGAEGPSTLEASYRIMRCFFMLQERPDLDRLRGFVARCRQSDGRYATAPGREADLGGTYFATIMLRWSRLLNGEPALVETAGFRPLFDGRTLDGWEGDTSLWSARHGMLVGTSRGLSHNDFLATEASYGDFLLKLSFRLVHGEGNSGVQFRSVRVPGHEMSGYQADIGQDYWGCLYDESRRNKVLVRASDQALKTLKKDGWNRYEIHAAGGHIRLALNGVNSVDYREPDPEIARDGKIAVQMHAGGPMEVQFKDLYIRPIPNPKADGSATPGFHLRSLKTGSGERKYTVYLPSGYDGTRSFPVILFLHGAGERGQDGVRCAQVGLGQAIQLQPDAFPFIAVFPQARRTWAADSDDARDALAALDEVLRKDRADRNRVLLTGLSMGGRGAWELAAAHPERFVAVVPICGVGRTESAGTLKALPVWCFVGDADRERTVLNTRAMVEAIRKAGGSARETEYRDVGHNSWDRAYNDRRLIEWMLAQGKK